MNKEILRLAIPNILSNLSIPLLSTVDTALMGQLSSSHLAAVGIGSMCFSFIYWNFGFLRMGTTGLTAQAYGANQDKGLVEVLVRSVLLACFIALIIWVLQKPIYIVSIELLDISAHHSIIFKEYFEIRIWAAPATLMLYALLGWFFGVQNAIIPLVITIFINVVNIVLSYYYVNVLELGAEGVAKGTVYAQFAGLLLALLLLAIFYSNKLRKFNFSRKDIFNPLGFNHFINVNKDIFIRTVFLTLAFGFFYKQSSSMGELILATNIVLMQFVNWMSYGIDGFAYASESLVGKYYGASSFANLKKVVKYCFVWSLVIALMYSVVYYLFEDSLVAIFTDDFDVQTAVSKYYFWILIIPLLATSSYIWDGVFVGVTASKEMRNSMIISFLIYILAFFGIENQWSNHALWLALAIFLLSRGLVQTWMAVKYANKQLRL